jgi:hypothetical protein
MQPRSVQSGSARREHRHPTSSRGGRGSRPIGSPAGTWPAAIQRPFHDEPDAAPSTLARHAQGASDACQLRRGRGFAPPPTRVYRRRDLAAPGPVGRRGGSRHITPVEARDRRPLRSQRAHRLRLGRRKHLPRGSRRHEPTGLRRSGPRAPGTNLVTGRNKAGVLRDGPIGCRPAR